MYKQSIKLSKKLLLDLSLLKYSQSDEVFLQPEYHDNKKCSKECPFYNTNNSICNTCVFNLSTSSIIKKRDNYLTHSQVKQLLFYISTIFENNGITIELTHEKVAKAIDCSIRTVRDNINALTEAGYIVVNNSGSKYKVFVKDFNKYHEKGTRGYLYVSNKLFKTLLKINNINILRAALFMLVKLDDMKISKTNHISKQMDYKILINILPSNITCIKHIKNILINLYNIFIFKFKKNSFEYSFKNDKDILSCLNNIKNDNKSILKKIFNRFNFNLTEKDKEDLLQISVQYNINILYKALKMIKTLPKNLPSYLRFIIKDNINFLALN